MAAATITATEYGYSITGGTDATSINTGKVYVKSFAFSGNADNATAVLTSSVSGVDVSCAKFMSHGTELDIANNNIWLGEKGVAFTGLKVTLGNTGSHLYVYVA